jgi:hypothetical protein
MSVQIQSHPTAFPASTPVDGSVTLSVDVLVSDDLEHLDLDYIITDQKSAVYFGNGRKEERRRKRVTGTQMRLAEQLDLKCGDKHHQAVGAEILLSISSKGVPQVPPVPYSIGITRFTCGQGGGQ